MPTPLVTALALEELLKLLGAVLRSLRAGGRLRLRFTGDCQEFLAR